jgi:hypothetical protein
MGTFFGVLWLLNVIAFVLMAYLEETHYIFYPIVFILFLIIFLLNPFRVMKQSSRFWLLKILVSFLCNFLVLNINFFFINFSGAFSQHRFILFNLLTFGLPTS